MSIIKEIKMKKLILILIVGSFFMGCAPVVNYTPILGSQSPKPVEYNVLVYDEGDAIPNKYTTIGTLKVGDGGMSTGCEYLEDVIRLAKRKARSVGGDAIQITSIKRPSPLSSTCFRITANVIIFNNTKDSN
jgi:hypothetical protein